MNGESSVHIDRGRWLYRFALDAGNIAIYRSRRAGQSLVPAEVWRALAVLGVSDAFIVPLAGAWAPFIEVAEGRQRWALERRPTLEQAELATRHFLGSLADAIAHSPQLRSAALDKDSPEAKALRPPLPPVAPAEDAAAEDALSRARAAREAEGWELIYSRQRASR